MRNPSQTFRNSSRNSRCLLSLKTTVNDDFNSLFVSYCLPVDVSAQLRLDTVQAKCEIRSEFSQERQMKGPADGQLRPVTAEVLANTFDGWE